MGLGERRAAKAYEDGKYVELKKQIDEAAGFEVNMEIHWDKIAIEGEADRIQEDWYFTGTYFAPLIDALKHVGGDEMGRAALKKGLKKVVITFDAATAPSNNYAAGWPFKDGVLTINYQAGVNSEANWPGSHKRRVDAIVQNLEAGL